MYKEDKLNASSTKIYKIYWKFNSNMNEHLIKKASIDRLKKILISEVNKIKKKIKTKCIN